MTTTTLVAAATPPPAPARPSRTTRALLLCGAVASPLFVLAFLVEGATRDDYHPLRHPVSSLAIGAYGWAQTLNFLVCGLLTLGFAVGVRRAIRPGRAAVWGPLLIGVWSVGLLGAGILVTDPVSGFPPGTPDLPPEPTHHGRPARRVLPALLPGLGGHLLRLHPSVPRRTPVRLGHLLLLTGLAFLASDVLATAGFHQVDNLVDLAGLWQRIMIVIGLLWLALLAAHLLRHLADTTASHARR